MKKPKYLFPLITYWFFLAQQDYIRRSRTLDGIYFEISLGYIYIQQQDYNANEYKNNHLFSSSLRHLCVWACLGSPGRGNGMKNQQILMQRAILKASRDIYVIINSPHNTVKKTNEENCGLIRYTYALFVFVVNTYLNLKSLNTQLLKDISKYVSFIIKIWAQIDLIPRYV